MDYMFYKSIIGSKLKSYVVSYDIACQWSIHLRERMFALDSVATARAVESQLSGRCALNKLGKIMKILMELE